MTPKSSMLVLAMIGGSDVQVEVAGKSLFVSPKPGEERLHPDLEALGIVGSTFAQRCESILETPAWRKISPLMRLPLLEPLLDPRIASGTPLALALIATKQQPAHAGDTWMAARLIRRLLAERHEAAVHDGLLRWIESDALVLDENPADYDVAQRRTSDIRELLSALPDIDKVIVAPTGGTPAFAAMLIAGLGNGADIGVPVLWEYVPRGSKRATRLAAPGQTALRALGRSILRHVRRCEFRIAAALAEGFPFARQRADMVSVLAGHAAMLDADYAAASLAFRRAGVPIGVAPSVSADWASQAAQLESDRSAANQGQAKPEAQARLIEVALLRARAFLVDGNIPLAVLATDAACEQLAFFAVTVRSGRVPADWMQARGEGQGARALLQPMLAEHAPDIARWFSGPQPSFRTAPPVPCPALLRMERNRSHLVHGHGGGDAGELVSAVLQSAEDQFERLASRRPVQLGAWVDSVRNWVEACLAEADCA